MLAYWYLKRALFKKNVMNSQDFLFVANGIGSETF